MDVCHYAGELQYSGSSAEGEKKVHIIREVPLPQLAGNKEDKFHTEESKKRKKKQLRLTEEISEKCNVSKWLAGRHALARVSNMPRKGYGRTMKTYKVDGYHQESETILEFYGCLFHGCPECYDPDCKSPVGNETMRELYQKTLDREVNLREGFQIVTMWECEWDHLTRGVDEDEELEASEIQAALDELKLSPSQFEIDAIKPRDALVGGRVNNAKLLHECTEEGVEICYVDVTSLYPFVMRNRLYPMGHPKIIRHQFDHTIDRYFGLAKAVLLPPQDLFHPVLPVKIKDGDGSEKLMFPLCGTCARERNFVLDSCQHAKEERQIQGCWITPEIYLAMRMGYKVVRFIEEWDYPYKSEECFKGYIDMFFKLKAQAKGFPSGVNTEEEKDEYIRKYEENGILLDKEAVKKDATMYQLAKLFLNTLWGYFCKNPHAQPQTSVTTDPAKFKFKAWAAEGGEISKAGIINHDKPVIERFSVALGDRKPIRGVGKKRKCTDEDENDSDYDSDRDIDCDRMKRSADDRFKLAPVILRRKYSVMITKLAPQPKEGSDQFVCYPFGYKRKKTLQIM